MQFMYCVDETVQVCVSSSEDLCYMVHNHTDLPNALLEDVERAQCEGYSIPSTILYKRRVVLMRLCYKWVNMLRKGLLHFKGNLSKALSCHEYEEDSLLFRLGDTRAALGGSSLIMGGLPILNL